MTKVRTLYVLKEDAQPPEAVRPQVFIETTAAGKMTYGVRVSGRSLSKARVQAEAEFAKLRAFADSLNEVPTAPPIKEDGT